MPRLTASASISLAVDPFQSRIIMVEEASLSAPLGVLAGQHAIMRTQRDPDYDPSEDNSAITQTRAGQAAWWVYGYPGATFQAASLSGEESARAYYTTISTKYSDDWAFLDDWSWTSQVYQYTDYLEEQPRFVRSEDFRVDYEQLHFSGQQIATITYPPSAGSLVILIQSKIVSALTGQLLIPRHNGAGVFTLDEPGFGMLVVRYDTHRTLLSQTYSLYSSAYTSAEKKQFARDFLLTPQATMERSPPILVLCARADDVKVQALASAKRVLSPAYLASNLMSELSTDLTEQARQTVERRIVSSSNPSAYVDVKIPTQVQLTDASGRPWTLNFSGGLA